VTDNCLAADFTDLEAWLLVMCERAVERHQARNPVRDPKFKIFLICVICEICGWFF